MSSNVEISSKTQVYFTHFNGDRPYRVEISSMGKGNLDRTIEKIIKVYKADGYTDEFINFRRKNPAQSVRKNIRTYTNNPIATYTSPIVFIGNSFRKSKETDGNSIIIACDNEQSRLGRGNFHSQFTYEYIYIGECIFRFYSLYKIVEYHSPIGNSNVPYPYAIDQNEHFYLMIEDVIIEKFMNEYDARFNDPYAYYYRYEHITKDINTVPPSKPKNKFKEIEKFFIGKEEHTLNYRPNPKKEYERLIRIDTDEESSPPIEFSIELSDGTVTILSKEDYCKLIKEFGKLLNFKSLNSKKIDTLER